MVGHVLAAAAAAGATARAVVVGPDGGALAKTVAALAPDATVHEQSERRGTAHAVLAARKAFARPADDVVVLYADTPLVTAATIRRARQALAARRRRGRARLPPGRSRRLRPPDHRRAPARRHPRGQGRQRRGTRRSACATPASWPSAAPILLPTPEEDRQRQRQGRVLPDRRRRDRQPRQAQGRRRRGRRRRGRRRQFARPACPRRGALPAPGAREGDGRGRDPDRAVDRVVQPRHQDRPRRAHRAQRLLRPRRHRGRRRHHPRLLPYRGRDDRDRRQRRPVRPASARRRRSGRTSTSAISSR